MVQTGQQFLAIFLDYANSVEINLMQLVFHQNDIRKVLISSTERIKISVSMAVYQSTLTLRLGIHQSIAIFIHVLFRDYLERSKNSIVNHQTNLVELTDIKRYKEQ